MHKAVVIEVYDLLMLLLKLLDLIPFCSLLLVFVGSDRDVILVVISSVLIV